MIVGRPALLVIFFIMVTSEVKAGECLIAWLEHRKCHPAPVTQVATAYPLCFYDVELGAVEAARSSWEHYAKRVAAGLVPIVRDPTSVAVISSRTVVVRTSRYRHSQIRKVWPEIACIGQSGGMTSEGRRNICRIYIASIIAQISGKRKSSLPQPVCQTFWSAEN